MQWLIILLIALLLALTIVKFRQLRRDRRRQDTVTPVLNELLPDGMEARPRMLLYFYSEHCGNCRSASPLIEELDRHGEEVVKVDVRRHLMTARQFGIRETPSLVLVERGRIACVHAGTINDSTLQQFCRGNRL